MPHQSRSQFLTLLESVAVGGCDGPIFSERKRVGVVAAGGPATPGKAKRKEPLGSWACNPLFFIGFGRRGTQPVPGDPALVCLRRFRNLESAPGNTSPAFADSLGFRQTWAARPGPMIPSARRNHNRRSQGALPHIRSAANFLRSRTSTNMKRGTGFAPDTVPRSCAIQGQPSWPIAGGHRLGISFHLFTRIRKLSGVERTSSAHNAVIGWSYPRKGHDVARCVRSELVPSRKPGLSRGEERYR